MIGDILVKVAKGDLLTQEEARILLEWGQALNNAPDLFGQLFKGLSSVGTLADITRDLGTVNRGAFISGNAGDPLDASGNNPFTGVAMMSPGIPVLSGADEASIFGMNEGDLMFWLSNLTGSVLAGGGRVVLNTTGVNLELGTDETDTQVAVKWFDDTDFQRSYVIGYATSPKNALQLEAQPYTGKDSEVLIKASSPSGKEGAVRIYAYEDGKPMSEVALESPGAGTVSEARLAVYDTSTNPKASIILLDDSANHASVGLAVYNDSGLNTVHAELRDDTARLEIGSNDGGDHFFPSRNAPNPNVYFNEANQDMDFIVEGTSDGALIYADAGNNRVGIGDSTPSYKLDVDGDVNVSSGSVYRVNGTALSSIFADISNGVTNGNSHNHVGGDGADLTYLDAILAYASGTSQVPAGTTYYFWPHLASMQLGIGAIIYPVAGTMKNMAVRLSTAQPGTGSLVITLMKNLSATSLVITIPAGSAGGTTHTNTVNTVAWDTFDLLSWRIVNNASSTSGSVTSFSMQQERNTT